MSNKYYCVGFFWDDAEPKNQLPRFLIESVWENGYDDKFLETVNSVPKGARIAAKTTFIKGGEGKRVSVLKIHAIGTVTNNYKDGQTLDVEWDKDFKPFELEGRGAYRSTISQVHSPQNIKLIFEYKTSSSKDTPALAFDPTDLTDDFPKNIILYGPPGTGKTYHTINKAVSIAEGIKEERLLNRYSSRNELKDRFDELLIEDWENPNGQIAFVTFHQSMSYEDFIEGLKPVTNDKDEISYEVLPGIFKIIASLAQNNWLDSQKGNSNELSFEEAFTRLKELWEDDQNMEFSMKQKDKNFTVLNFGKSSIRFRKSNGSTGHTLSINTLRDYFYNRKDVRKTGVGIYYPGVLEKLRSFSPELGVEKEPKNYVLVIDEINRGNISQIFGELITLIEGDKRLGEKEALSTVLPYSKEKFVVPPNLHIVGTMNTADRSVEALDTALRRRFVFEEKDPEPELLLPERMISKLWWEHEGKSWKDGGLIKKEKALYALIGFSEELITEDEKEELWLQLQDEGRDAVATEAFHEIIFTGINLSTLLIYINKRIEKLLSKDYKIGHAYLINVLSLSDLRATFQNKILPLLQEYFFGDYGRIGLVIGESFVINPAVESTVDLMSVSGYDTGDLNETKVYQIQDVQRWDDETFMENVKAIYGE